MAFPSSATSSAANVSNSFNNSTSQSTSNSWANTAGIQASLQAIQNAQNANSSAWDAWKQAAEYNAEEAQKQREWQEKMANTVYQRTTKDMIAAGINPILAATNGFGSGAVGSGATAALAAPNTYMANTFPEMNSASTAQSSSEGHGESHAEGWSHSESGLATFLTSMTGLFTGLANSLASGKTIDVNLSGLKELLNKDTQENGYNSKINEKIDDVMDKIVNEINDFKYPYDPKKKNKVSVTNGVKQLPDLDYYINYDKMPEIKKPGIFTPYTKKKK